MLGDSERQLSLLTELATILAGVSVPFWLRGGWALDFLVGRITWEHADIDLVAFLEDRDKIYELLTASGFEHDRELRNAAIDFKKDDQSIQFALVEFASGLLVTRGFESWPWPDGTLDGPWCEIEGVRCRTLAAYALLEEKESYERNRGRPLREKDHASIVLLRRIVAERLVKPS